MLMTIWRCFALAILAATSFGGAAAATPGHPGEAPYKTYCAACHEAPDLTRAPSRETLARMSRGQILNAMMTGKMTAQAAAMSSKEVEAVAAYLSPPREAGHDWVKAMTCPADRRSPDFAAPSPVANFGFDLKNRRNLSFAQSGFKPGDLSRLRLAWAIAFPDTVSMRSQAAVVGTTLFLPVGESGGRLFAFDVSDRMKPCVQWVYEAGRTLRSSAAFGVRSDGRPVVMVGDAAGHLHMIDARTGKRLWETQSGLFPTSTSTGTPVLVGDRVIAPSSQYEIMVGASDAYECCKVHGGVVALDAMTGRRLWAYHTMEAAKPVRDRGDGQMLWGPSGAPIWTSPAIDVARGLIYVGTGEATSPPAHRNTDALIAIDLATGKEVWSFQATANAIYLSGCNRVPVGRNCVPKAETVYRDVDFGASAVLASRPGGG
ncbi:MAG: PQQ-binding-like beta-propeller repeat protein, partial [Phenylobacterium sp.]|nr:PQQ-binding-like beta-propeller repeat protein [Phenylobacterium sp.]